MKPLLVTAILIGLIGLCDSRASSEENELSLERRIIISLSIQSLYEVPDDAENKKVFFTLFLFPNKLKLAIRPDNTLNEVKIEESVYLDFENYLAVKLSTLAARIVNESEMERNLNSTHCWIELTNGDRTIYLSNIFDRKTIEEIIENVPFIGEIEFPRDKLNQILEQIAVVNAANAP